MPIFFFVNSQKEEFGSYMNRIKYIIRHFKSGLNAFCSPDDINTLMGDELDKTTKDTTSLPGDRCFTDDLFHPGRCIEPTCLDIKYCGTKGHHIVGKCKSRNYEGGSHYYRHGPAHDRLCCMPPK